MRYANCESDLLEGVEDDEEPELPAATPNEFEVSGSGLATRGTRDDLRGLIMIRWSVRGPANPKRDTSPPSPSLSPPLVLGRNHLRMMKLNGCEEASREHLVIR